MLLVPSLSIKNGLCTGSQKGVYSEKSVYSESPLSTAHKFAEHGITNIQLIDLDGANKGKIINYPTLELITGHTSLKVNYTGGIHTDGDVLKAFEFKADSISAATIAVYNKELYVNWIMSYGRERVTLAADILDGHIRVGGWQKDTKITLDDHVEFYFERGLKYLKTTDINREGVLEGPSFELYDHLIKKFPGLQIFASGGVRNMDDIKQLADMGIHGVIFGRAYHEGKITLKEIEDFIAGA